MEKIISSLQGLAAVIFASIDMPIMAGVFAALSISSAIIWHAERRS